MVTPTSWQGPVADLLGDMSAAMKARGDIHRARAYARAARAVRAEAAFDKLLAHGQLQDIPGIGPAIEKKIQAFVERGEKPSWLDEPAEMPRTSSVDKRPIPKAFLDAPFPEAPDLHCHTRWSDGSLTLEEVVVFARRLGARAIGISDHSGSLHVANGLKPAEVLRQWAEIERVQERHPDVHILKGTECDILRDGRLDHPEHILAGFDYVVGSLHSHLRLPEKEQTERVLAALESPYITVLGHPTTAVPGHRPAANLDWEAVFAKAAEQDVALEINGNPGRLDLPVRLIRQAKKAGCRFSLGSDGHNAGEMLSLATARRMAGEAGLGAEDLVNFDLLPLVVEEPPG